MTRYRPKTTIPRPAFKCGHPERTSIFSDASARPHEYRVCAECLPAVRAKFELTQGKRSATAIRERRAKQSIDRQTRTEAGPRLTLYEIWRCLNAYDGRCVYCGDEANSLDHLVPITRGGKTNLENLVGSCRSCNSSKGNKLIFHWTKVPSHMHPPTLQMLKKHTLELLDKLNSDDDV